ncbi:hypothetical protein NFI96_007899 [Prochilodus magdalenae]|nr:hypothetical protein NFI96_007899 [Prochilodus magdalenae]
MGSQDQGRVGQTEKKTTPTLQTLLTAVPPIYPVCLLVLGVLLFLSLVLLVVLLYQNRRLRRVLSKRRSKPPPEAVYEEIDRRYNTKRNESKRRRSVLSEAQHSGYENVDDELISGESAQEDPAKSYGNVITAGQIADGAPEDMTDNYDDAVSGLNSSIMLMINDDDEDEDDDDDDDDGDDDEDDCNEDDDDEDDCDEDEDEDDDDEDDEDEEDDDEDDCDEDDEEDEDDEDDEEDERKHSNHIRKAAVTSADQISENTLHSFQLKMYYNSTVRLVNGERDCTGTVEIFDNGQWGTVCNYDWDMRDAAVVCREVGCGEAVAAITYRRFGPGSGPILMGFLQCNGSESTLKNCKSHLSYKIFCTNHETDAGVICSGDKARLKNGPHLCSGRVEMPHREARKAPYTVCDADFDRQDAEVVCRELGCGLPMEVLGGAVFGRGEGQVWSEEFQCRGEERQIYFCPRSPSLNPNCSHDSDVGLICSGHTGAGLVNGFDFCSGRVEIQYLSSSLALHEGQVRLSGECEGEVEVYFRQDWRRVLLDSWSESLVSVVCRQLGCGTELSFSNSSTSSPEHVCVKGFNCSGSEAHLGNCSSAQAVNCSSREQLYITCSGKFNSAHSSIRLVGSGGDCAGRLEVFHSGSWGTVCDDLWGIEDAQVVCRQLQCGVALNVPVPAQFGPGTGPIWFNEVECEGNETSLRNCRYHLCGEDECGHKEDVGVVCSEYKEIRLTEGCEGNLEVFYNGTWGNVCVNGMDAETATLICQELNCGRSGNERDGKARVGSAPNWLDNLKCRKHDSTLWHCPSSPWGQNTCDNRYDVARITCSEDINEPVLRSHLKCSSSAYQRQCSNYLPLRLRGGEGSCSGRLEVYHNAGWGSVCADLWDIRDAQVVCRQMGCGRALSADRRAVGADEGHIWMNRVKCRGNEIHLWDCLHSLKNHTDCSHRQHAGVTCTDVSVPPPPTARTTASILTATPQRTPLPAVSYTYPVSILVLGVLLFLALVLLVVLLYQNRRLRRVLSKRRETVIYEGLRRGLEGVYEGLNRDTERVYEEILCRPYTARDTQKGSIFSEEYEDVDEGLLSGSVLSEAQHSGYEDVDEELLSGESAKEGPAESYDDVITAGQISDGVAEDVAEGYDDVITADQSSAVVAEDMTDNYDDAVTGPNSNIMLMDTPEDYDDVITDEQDYLQSLWGRGGEACSAAELNGLCAGQREMDSCVALILLSSTITLSTAGSVRLVDGGSHCVGRVEVHYNGTWGTVCHNNWGMNDAAVVCRELGCGEAVDALVYAHFGPGSGPIWVDNVDCDGSESTLKNCRSAAIRLVGGSHCSGRVEVLHGETWYTVCDTDFDQQDAEVVCRELGCGLPVEVLGGAAFGRGEGQVWSEELQCRGNESQIHSCPTSPSLKHNCSHDNDVGLVCAEVRLVGGSRCSGRVEVLHGETWYTVCDADFDQQDAEVACRELGCGLPVEVLGGAAFGRGEVQVWSEELQCRGNESQIHSCPTSPSLKHNCSHDSDVGLVCADSVRLVNGDSRCAGRVEVLHRGQWGTVCSYNWDLRDAAVVCRELRCGEAVNALRGAHFGPGSDPIWMDNVGCSETESTLKHCRSVGWGQHFCNHDWDAGVICSGRISRLTDGFHLCSGRVEVLYGETWSTVCDADFDQQDAEVVCRELGCGLPVEVLGGAAFGRGEVQVWSNMLHCRGNESEMYFCPVSSSLKHNCSHDSDVGLVCAGNTHAQLVNGSDSCSGRVELQYLSEWGTVCDVSWNMRAASVLCGQLKCGSAVAVVGSDWFGEGSGQIWADVFDCQGNETHLSQCPISSWSRTACSHKQDAGVICNGDRVHEARVRFSGGMECKGEVEVYFRQEWRRVLLDSWSGSVASVVCRQLGCGSVFSFSSSSTSSPEHRHMCVTGLNCSGSEAHLGNCSSAQAVNCSSREQLYITCSGKFNSAHSSIRLVGSGGDCAGRLEVFHSGSWGTVCDDLWDIKDAQVVCRQLQCGVALSAPVPAQFGPGTGPMWLNEVECEGNETSLWNCRFQLCGEDECEHMEDVGVVCSEYKEIRLTEGCEGNLEVFYNGTWGNVCVNGMTEETASVVCRELNCGSSGSVSWGRARVESAPNWLDDVKCRKHDSTLWQCPSSLWGQNSCDNNNEVSHITCSDKIRQTTRQTCSSSLYQKRCSNHLPLRLSGGNRSCSGRLEVYHNAEWGSVCDDQWDIRDAQVVCRQLGCGSALSANESAVFGAGSGPVWLNRVKCRGNEIHLWDCPHSLKNHTDCSHKQHAGVTCTDTSVSSSTTPIITTTTTTVGQPAKPRTTPSPSLPIYPVSLLVLGVVLLLVLVLLVVLLYQNRRLRRVLSKRRRKTLTEAVYEEIDRRHITKGNDPIESGESAKEDPAESYDDVITAGQISDEDMTDNYDDAVTGPNSNIMLMDTPESYDDVITDEQDVTAGFRDLEDA